MASHVGFRRCVGSELVAKVGLDFDLKWLTWCLELFHGLS